MCQRRRPGRRRVCRVVVVVECDLRGAFLARRLAGLRRERLVDVHLRVLDEVPDPEARHPRALRGDVRQCQRM